MLWAGAVPKIEASSPATCPEAGTGDQVQTNSSRKGSFAQGGMRAGLLFPGDSLTERAAD